MSIASPRLALALSLVSCHPGAPSKAQAPPVASTELPSPPPVPKSDTKADTKADTKSDTKAEQRFDPGEPEPPEPPPPARVDDVAAFATKVDFDWSPLVCPSPEACLGPLDYVAVVGKQGWTYSWMLDYSGRDSAIAAGVTDPAERALRFAAGVRHVMAVEKLEVLDASCGFVRYMPQAFGHTEAGIEVKVGRGARGKVPKAMTPTEANERVRAAYEALGYMIDESRAPRMFGDAEVARMTGTGLEGASVRRVSAWIGSRDTESEALLYAVYSPTSAQVYLLDRSFNDLPRPAAAARARKHGEQLAALLRGLKLTTVRFDLDAACEIPKALGGRAWLPFAAAPK